MNMKTFKVTLRFIGLSGEYLSVVEIQARNTKSASKKASLRIGNQDGYVVSVCEFIPAEVAKKFEEE